MNRDDHRFWCYDRPYGCGSSNGCRRGEDRFDNYPGNNSCGCNRRDEDSWCYGRPLRRQETYRNTYDENSDADFYAGNRYREEDDDWSQRLGGWDCNDWDAEQDGNWVDCQDCVPCEWCDCGADTEEPVQDGAINLNTTVNVWQSGDARGGDANGGDCGGAGGTAGDGGTVSNSAITTVVDVVVVVGSGNGNNNTGGDGTIEPIALDLNGRKVNIQLSDNGQTYVNGERLEEQQLGDGTKVYVFRKEEVKEA